MNGPIRCPRCGQLAHAKLLRCSHCGEAKTVDMRDLSPASRVLVYRSAMQWAILEFEAIVRDTYPVGSQVHVQGFYFADRGTRQGVVLGYSKPPGDVVVSVDGRRLLIRPSFLTPCEVTHDHANSDA